MKACPNCKSVSKQKLKRRPIIKLFRGSKGFSCKDCNTAYTWFPIINKSLRV